MDHVVRICAERQPERRLGRSGRVEDGARHLGRIAGIDRVICRRYPSAHLADRRIPVRRRLHGPLEIRLEAGAHPSWFDDREINPEFGDFLAHTFRESLQSPLGGVVWTADGGGYLSADARDLDDSPTALLAHRLEKGTRDLDGGEQVRGTERRPLHPVVMGLPSCERQDGDPLQGSGQRCAQAAP
jgi:hypothetical protein